MKKPDIIYINSAKLNWNRYRTSKIYNYDIAYVRPEVILKQIAAYKGSTSDAISFIKAKYGITKPLFDSEGESDAEK